MFSAVKQGGVPLHRLARQGELVERAPKKVRIKRLELLRYQAPDAEIAVECSAGIYVRTLAADLGEALGTGAYLKALRRIRSGSFDVSQAATAEALQRAADEGEIETRLIAAEVAMELPVLQLSVEGARRVLHGGEVPSGTTFREAPGARALALDAEGRLLAVMELRADRRLWPLRVLRAAGD